ncbi:hypothetical protein SAMN02745245_00488 [Anaerosphaera aminiphila DSM 21120]|uniref:YlxP-like protein n=1 Tax=Anaerosphaera aminiphila DSM 21120 TaxID=1120995 RepID=A0A1M5PVS3_9FIRM|nr:DUF503 domain-containing protein [Anaerosphaera aminiphila]SHH05750.1 hypothetical protein SAMN02745245_00488 [Anaerosphaera aminiphila DSM 21120]
MIIGTCKIELRLFSPNSLKEKRRILNSLIERLKNKFNISVAEVGSNELWQKSTLGIAVVTNNTSHANEVLDKVIDFIDDFADVEIISVNIEIL